MNRHSTSYYVQAEKVRIVLTVDGDGDALGEHKAVSALEGGDLSELVELQVVGWHALRRLGVDELDLEAILLRDCQERGSTRVTLLASRQNLFACAEWCRRRRWRHTE